MKTLTGLEASKSILDPVHGNIFITQIELEVISTKIFQRLRKITQLGMDYAEISEGVLLSTASRAITAAP